MSFLKELVDSKMYDIFIKNAGDEAKERLKIAEELVKTKDVSPGRALAEALDVKLKK